MYRISNRDWDTVGFDVPWLGIPWVGSEQCDKNLADFLVIFLLGLFLTFSLREVRQFLVKNWATISETLGIIMLHLSVFKETIVQDLRSIDQYKKSKRKCSKIIFKIWLENICFFKISWREIFETKLDYMIEMEFYFLHKVARNAIKYKWPEDNLIFKIFQQRWKNEFSVRFYNKFFFHFSVTMPCDEINKQFLTE